MLTRIEIDGFKSFEDFTLDLPPFAVIIGPNAAGKSNLFDALRLLSRLAVMDVRSAMREVRGESYELFRRLPDGSVAERLTLAVETLLEPKVRDEYGQEIELSCTRIRYEISIVRRTVGGIERLFVEREAAEPIRRDDDRWQPYGQAPSFQFRQIFMRYRKRKPFLETQASEGQRLFLLHQDGRQGRNQRVPAVEAERSVLSNVTLAGEFPHLYALRRELEDLRYLQLDPTAERRPSPLDAPEILEQDGSNLAAVLYRIERETRTEARPRGALADILADLAEIIPDVIDLAVERDDERREYRLRVTMRDGQPFNARVVSDGTLRVLAFLALLHDPRHRGILCFEEPENGVHKSRLEAMMHFLQESCARPHDEDVEPDDSLLQIIVNTHSLVAARAVRDMIILADMIDSVGAGRTSGRRTRMSPYRLVDQGDLPLVPTSDRVTMMQVEQFLEQSKHAA